MPVYLLDAVHLTWGILHTLLRVAYDNINPFTERLDFNNLHNEPKLFSRLIGQDVIAVEPKDKAAVGLGAGGTGTTRRAFLVRLKDNRVLHVFAKTATHGLMERVFLNQFGVYDNELSFYQTICPALSNEFSSNDGAGWSPCPKVHCARKIGSTNFIIILEDVNYRPQGCEIQDINDLFRKENGQVIFKQFSMLHAKYWRNPPPNLWRYNNVTGKSLGQTPPLNKFLAHTAMRRVQKQFGDKLKLYPDCLRAYELLLQHYETVRRYWSQGPITFCHGDSHIGNVFFSKDRSLAGFLDYQCVSQEHCMRDVSYYLINSCTAVALSDVEKSMIKFYLDSLREYLAKYHGENSHYLKDVPSFDEAYFMHRSYALWCLLAWTICCGFLDIVQESFIVYTMQRMLDTCQRLDILDVMQTLIEMEKKGTLMK